VGGKFLSKQSLAGKVRRSIFGSILNTIRGLEMSRWAMNSGAGSGTTDDLSPAFFLSRFRAASEQYQGKP
jgi:hypothetical protein